MDEFSQTGDKEVTNAELEPGGAQQMGLELLLACFLQEEKGTPRHRADRPHLQIIHYFSVVPLNSPSADGYLSQIITLR